MGRSSGKKEKSKERRKRKDGLRETRRKLSPVCSSSSSPSSSINLITTKHVIALVVFAGVLLLANSPATCSASAVKIRPTEFKSDSEEVPARAPAPQATGQQQQQQVGSQAAAHQAHPILHHQQASTASSINSNNNNNAIPTEQGQQQGTKITPLKSAFCTSAQTGLKLDAPLGLSSMQVDDLALSASSRSNELVGPQFARLNQDNSGGAWCPERPISPSNFGKEWIQVKLNRSFVITALETQGRYYNGNGKEFAPSYQIEYSRNGGLTWHKWKDFHGSVLLRGNEDVNSAVKNELSPPIVGANVIRILPYSALLRTVCLRFELHGCLYDEGAPISYETNDGVVEPRWGHLVDYTYDGLKLPASQPMAPANSHLARGLGQLVDGVRGNDNFAFNSGFEWVGWKSMNGDVVIEFTFRTLRNFRGALFHSNNMVSNGVEVFQAVDVHYGIDVPLSMEAIKDSLYEQQRRSSAPNSAANNNNNQQRRASDQLEGSNTLWSSEVNNIEYEPDRRDEHSRPVTVHLKSRFANKLRFVLKFASKWILISEVEFVSQPVELLSLATCQDEQTPVLMAALQPAKSYDEYVAILREHQLRRTVTNAIKRQNKLPPSSLLEQQSDNNLDNSSQNSQMAIADESSSISSRQQTISSSEINFDLTTASNRKLATDIGSYWSPASSQGDQLAQPSINANLNRFMQPDSSLQQQQQQQPANQAHGDTESAKEAPLDNQHFVGNPNNKLGLATVISLVFVSILVFLGLVLAISSYRLRLKHPKLGIPRLPGQHLSPHRQQHQHIVAGGQHSPKGFRNFMSVFSNSSATSSSSSSNSNHNLRSAAAAAAGNGPVGDYNAIFANVASNVITTGTGSSNTLKKLDNFGTSKRPAQTMNQHNYLTSQHQHHNHQLSFGAASPLAVNHQLLVSVKDNHSTSRQTTNHLFGFNSQTSKPQSVNTQLILGLNQANPLAQQQIYNNMNNYSNQTYSMSMASSSTNGHQGDYGDYAIPDVPNGPTIIAPLVPHNAAAAVRQLPQQQQSHQMNLNNFNNTTNNSTNVQQNNDSFQMFNTNNRFNQMPTMDSGG